MTNLEMKNNSCSAIASGVNSELAVNYLQAENCRRYQLDRRVTTLSFIERIFHSGARTQHRRNSDHHDFKYFDRHEPHLFFMSIIVILFSLFDALLTLKILAGGGVELNYFANILIGFGLYGFIFSKYLITAFGMIVLVFHKHYQVFMGFQVRHLIYGIVFIYTALILYEIIIINIHLS
ncbi:MAG: DUF5658 family protein [Gammaproteobacteria bacterium]